MPKLVANRDIRYGGKAVKAGETFEVRDKDVKVLRAVKYARDPDPEAPKTQRRPPAPKVEKVVPVEPTAPEPTQSWSTASTYQRRDMKAED